MATPWTWDHLPPKAAEVFRNFERAHAYANATANDYRHAEEQLARLNDEADAITMRPTYDPEAITEARAAVGYAAAVFLEARRLHRIAREDFARAKAAREALDKKEGAR